MATSLAATGMYRTVASMLAAKMGGVITQCIRSGNRDPDWREDEYVITELECMGAKYCLIESDGEAVVMRESADSLFEWLDDRVAPGSA